jgi:hypothetical protein
MNTRVYEKDIHAFSVLILMCHLLINRWTEASAGCPRMMPKMDACMDPSCTACNCCSQSSAQVTAATHSWRSSSAACCIDSCSGGSGGGGGGGATSKHNNQNGVTNWSQILHTSCTQQASVADMTPHHALHDINKGFARTCSLAFNSWHSICRATNCWLVSARSDCALANTSCTGRT